MKKYWFLSLTLTWSHNYTWSKRESWVIKISFHSLIAILIYIDATHVSCRYNSTCKYDFAWSLMFSELVITIFRTSFGGKKLQLIWSTHLSNWNGRWCWVQCMVGYVLCAMLSTLFLNLKMSADISKLNVRGFQCLDTEINSQIHIK